MQDGPLATIAPPNLILYALMPPYNHLMLGGWCKPQYWGSSTPAVGHWHPGFTDTVEHVTEVSYSE